MREVKTASKPQALHHTASVIEHDQHFAPLHILTHHIPNNDHARPAALHRPDEDVRPPRAAPVRTDNDLGRDAGAAAPLMLLRVLVRHEADDQLAGDVDDLGRAGVVVGAGGGVDAAAIAPRLAVVGGAHAVDREEAVLLRLEDGDELGVADDGDAEHAVARDAVRARDDARLGPGAAAVGRGPHQAVLVRARVLARVVEL